MTVAVKLAVCVLALAMLAACQRALSRSSVTLLGGEHMSITIDPAKVDLLVEADRTGSARVNGQAYALDTLRFDLKQRYPHVPSRCMLLRIHPDSTCERVLHILKETVAMFGYEEAYFSARLPTGQEKAFWFGLPLLDGNRKHPWYAIIDAMPPGGGSSQVFHEPNWKSGWEHIRFDEWAGVTLDVHNDHFELLTRRLQARELHDELRKLKNQYGKLAVVIRPTEGVHYQRLIDALDVCNSTGIVSFGIGVAMPSTDSEQPTPESSL